MHALCRLLLRTPPSLRRPISTLPSIPPPCPWARPFSNSPPTSSSSSPTADDDEWNDAWESAWLPDNLSGKNRAPWETDVTYGSSSSTQPSFVLPSDADPDTKAFVEEMEERWDERKRRPGPKGGSLEQQQSQGHFVEQVVGRRDDAAFATRRDDDYRMRKQRIHAGLWMKEMEAMEETKLGRSEGGAGDIDRLLDSCSEIFDSGNIDLKEEKVPSTSEFKTKPDGWESTSRTPDGNIWEITQHEEDILLQEFERRIAYSKFQIASFIKSHIFSRRRPIDGWKYMIEELGPNAKRGKGSVQRLPSLADPFTQPFGEERLAITDNATSFKRR